MGGAFSCGQDNDDLVNILIVLGYIKTKKVEAVFREVDRGDYILPSHRHLAYKDLSWKIGNIHLSAPCIYCKVMEGLSLKPGLSFLNIGSGTGYLSTMAGLILGENGTNHGIEMHEDTLVYAYEHLEAFKEKYLNVDGFEFCEPIFQHGNFLNVIPNRQYDRVYCGASCPEMHEKFVKQFVRVGGILVMPYKDHLLRIERINETTWRNHTMLPVSFAMLALPQESNDRGFLHLPLCQPISLQELCRGAIRRRLRKIVWSEHNDLEQKVEIEPHSVVDRPSPRLDFGIPLFGEANNAQLREVIDAAAASMTSTLQQLVRVDVQPAQSNGRNVEEGSLDSDTSEDSDEDVTRFKIDLFDRFRTQNELEDSTKETETTETEMQENRFENEHHTPMEEDDPIEASRMACQENIVNDSGMKTDDTDCADSFDRLAESKLKRRKSEEPSSNNESNEPGDNKLGRFVCDNDIPEESQNGRISSSSSSVPVASTSDADDTEVAQKNLKLTLMQQLSILAGNFSTKMDENSESASSDLSNGETKGGPDVFQRNTVEAVDDREATSSLFDWNSEKQTHRLRIDKNYSNSEKSKKSSGNCSPGDRRGVDNVKNNVSCSDVSSEDEKIVENCRNQRYKRASQKRRSDERSESEESSNLQSQSTMSTEKRERGSSRRADTDKKICSNEGNNKSSDNCSPTERRSIDNEKNHISDSSGTSSEDEIHQRNSYRRCKRPSQKRPSDESSESKETSDSSQSSISTSSNSLIEDDDSDIELHFVQKVKRGKPCFAHTFRKDALTIYMREKIGQLPLPVPLRLYLNYNREF